MEKKKKDCKLASNIYQADNETNDNLRKEDKKNRSGEGLVAGKNSTIANSSHPNLPYETHGFQPIVQWPNTTQLSVENPPLISIPSISSQTLLSHWQQSQHLQPNLATHQVQVQQSPVWMAQRSGYPFAAANFPPYIPFPPIGPSDGNWQCPHIPGGGISARNQSQIPSFSYHVGYPYPGPWDPSSWWVQPQQSLPPCGYHSSPLPPVSGGSTASAHHFQRGIIRPPPKLSQKHQNLWEAQSAENLQLWAMVSHLQSEIADYKTHLMKLESDVLSLKPTTEAPIGTSLTEQTSKRGRPKRSIATADVLPSRDESRPRARGRKPSTYAQCENKELNFEREGITKVENKEKVNQILKDNHGLQMSSIAFDSLEFRRNEERTEESIAALSCSSKNVKGIEEKGVSGTCIGTSNGNFVWPSDIPLGDCERGSINISSNGFSGWTLGNGEDGLENASLGSPKDQDDEMEDDDISGGDIA